jgi:uroporphyrinogen-III synthase
VGALSGRRIVVTRRPEQSAVLTRGLAELGAEVLEIPLLEVAPPSDPGPLAAALEALEAYDYIALTSANAAQALADALARDARVLPPTARIASVGPSTSRAVRELLRTEPVLEPPSDFRAEGLLRAFEAADVAGKRVLQPVSDRARDLLAEGLRARDAHVDVVVAYRTATPPGAGQALDKALSARIDLITLASPSAVEGLVEAIRGRVAEVGVGVIGPVTEHAARAAGLDVRVVAAPSTAEGLVAAIGRHFESAAAGTRP